MAAPKKTASPAAEDDGLDSMDLCGFGCHSEGVAPGAVSVGCEHGTYAVTDQMRVKASAPDQVEPNVHAQQLHHHAEQRQAPDTSAIGPLLEQINALSERVTMLEATVRQLVGMVAPAEDDGSKSES
jgi:hypothetical protein